MERNYNFLISKGMLKSAKTFQKAVHQRLAVQAVGKRLARAHISKKIRPVASFDIVTIII